MMPTKNCWANGHGLPLLQDDFSYMHHVFPSIRWGFIFFLHILVGFPYNNTKETTLGWQWCQQLDLMQQSGHDSWATLYSGVIKCYP